MPTASLRLPAFQGPDIVQIEVTSRCNLNCRICAHAGLSDTGDMSLPLFRSIVDQLPVNPQLLYLCGLGEPLLHPDLELMIAHCGARGINRTIIHTNGTLLNPRRADRLSAVQLGEIRLSIDGGDHETLQRMRPGVRLETLIRNMRHVVRATSIGASLYFTANLENLASLPCLVDIARKMGIRKIFVVDTLPFSANGESVAPSATPAHKLSALDADWRRRILDSFRARAESAGIETTELLESFLPSCSEPFHKLYVTWRGAVTPCCRIHHQIVMGNLSEDDLSCVWHGKEMEAWRTILLSDSPPAICRELCKLPRQKQRRSVPNAGEDRPAPSDGRIDWNRSSEHIHNMVGAAPPPTGPWTTIRERRVRLVRTEVGTDPALLGLRHPPGLLLKVSPNAIVVQTGDGTLVIRDIAFKGKVYPASEFISATRCVSLPEMFV